ncbi:MAG TPA: amidohydrolase [Rectinemataceae bacterium]|nr:amidohydrolase [Rectinemataceae bacterium]
MKTILLRGASILTMDDAQPRVEALVLGAGHILFAGTEAEALAFAGGEVEVVDLGGRTVVPGFNDNHLHAVILGDHELAPDLGGLSEGEIVELLRDRWKDAPSDRILCAYNWDYPSCPQPRKELLDAAFPRNPVILSQFSGHAQWLNSRALEALGIRKGGPDPKDGQVLRDDDGEPTGIVRDLGDTGLSKKRFAKIFFDRAVREERLDIALARFRREGITSVQDNTWFPQPLASYGRYARAGRLTARFSCWSLGRQSWTTPTMRASFALGRALGLLPRDWLGPGPVKFFLDGAFSTRTACLCEPYADAAMGGEGASGLCSDVASPVAELEWLARRRLQGAFHIIGDRGIEIFLDAFEEVASRHPDIGELRIRIEHAQLVRREDIARIRDLGLLVAAQPSALGSPDKDEKLLGRERALRAYPYRSLLDGGVKLSFGSDIPGEATSDPLLSIHMAVNRSGPEAITALEAIRCYTRGSAYAEFAEGRKGALGPGMLADFVVLSADPTSVPIATIRDIEVDETWVGGRRVYSRVEEGGR